MLHFNTITVQTKEPDVSELHSYFMLPPQDHPKKIGKLQQRFPPNYAQLKLSWTPF